MTTLTASDRDYLTRNTHAHLDALGVSRRAKTVRAVAVELTITAATYQDHADGNGNYFVFPSVEYLANHRYVMATTRGVHKALAVLRDVGFLPKVIHTGRAAWRAVTGTVVNAWNKWKTRGRGADPAAPPSRFRRRAQRSGHAPSTVQVATTYPSEEKKNTSVPPAGRPSWATSPTSAPTPVPPPFVPSDSTGSSPEVRAAAMAAIRRVTKRR